jgi:hypothetical protein
VKFLPPSSLSTIKSLSLSSLNTSKVNDALSEIERCIKLIDSAKPASLGEGCDYISVENKNLAFVAYGRLVTEFSKILLMNSLDSLKEVMLMDHQYLSGNKVDQIETRTSEINANIELQYIRSQVTEIERWFGE